MNTQSAGRFAPITLSLLRIVSGLLFLPHGMQKLFGMFGGMGGQGAAAHFPQLSWFAGVIELAGGLLIMLGVCTRPVAFLCAGQMAFAYFMRHAPQGLMPIQNRGELAALYCFVFLFLSAAGGGPYAIERLWSKKS